MKNILTLLLFVTFAHAQERPCAQAKHKTSPARLQYARSSLALVPQISHELKYDVKFVHLDVNVQRNTKFISGNVKTVATVTIAPLDTFMTLLHQVHTIDSILFNGSSLAFSRKDSMVKVKVPSPLGNGTTFTTVVYYKGTAPVGGSAIGSGFSTGVSGSWGNQATWSLSESFVAYHWWPCKQILTDKIDSSWVFITTDSTNKAGSNGLLKNVVTTGSQKRFEWKSGYPIDYYLISVAVAKYKEYNTYAKPQYLSDSVLIQNYIYDNAINNSSWISQQKSELDRLPEVLKLFSNLYGMYPFYKEKYGHCMAPFGGGMEHQTMTSLGFFEYYINAHELGHQWWGDHVTCKSWGDIWINEGFAVYSEFLAAEYLDPSNFTAVVNDAHTNVMGQPGGSIHFTDTLNSNRIFSSRLTYDKGGSIIHTLRFLTNNDSLWFNTLRGFQNTYMNSTASAEDFKNYYTAQTGINATQFFNQWYYGQGYPTFSVKYNHLNNVCWIKNTQSVSMPAVTPVFITPLEYTIKRIGLPDTTLRLMHNVSVETYSFPLTGTIAAMYVDKKNWLINNLSGPFKDNTLGAVNAIGEENMGGFSINPNPSSGAFTINNPSVTNGSVEIYSLNGKLIHTKRLETATSIDLGSYPSSIYLVKIMDEYGDVVYTQKIIKQ
jgi:aminopeptidase N